jgi:hypothetical protein
VPRNNAQKEANESEIVFDREVWCAIRYLGNSEKRRFASLQLLPEASGPTATRRQIRGKSLKPHDRQNVADAA